LFFFHAHHYYETFLMRITRYASNVHERYDHYYHNYPSFLFYRRQPILKWPLVRTLNRPGTPLRTHTYSFTCACSYIVAYVCVYMHVCALVWASTCTWPFSSVRFFPFLIIVFALGTPLLLLLLLLVVVASPSHTGQQPEMYRFALHTTCGYFTCPLLGA
jgi:hypothetical protein